MPIINKGIFDTGDAFLRQTGNDWPTAQVLSTSDITEGVNLYFTNARVNAAVSGNLALKANVSDLTSANISELTNLYYTNARVLSYVSSLLTTSNVAEGSNLYYTNARVYSNVIALLPSLAGSGIAIQANGQISANAVVVTFDSISQFLTTSNVAEGSNLYYTNARVNSFIQGNLATKANVTDLTTANVSELTNLYYTNNRVYSNVIALLPTLAGQNITIQANGQISASSGAVTFGDISQFLTTSNVSEGSNLYYTNARAVSAFTEGSGIAISSGGVISARGDSAGSGLFNSGIQLVGNTLAQSTFSNVKVFSFAEGNTFIGYSFHVTNITSNIVYLTGRHVFDSNTTLFANLLEMPVGASMEVFRKPQVFRANDIIQIQGFDQNRTAVNNGISSYLSYQATVDDTYQRAGNTITGNALTTIYQTVGRVSIFESINLVNLSPNVIYGTVIVTDGSDNLVAYLAANLAIPAYASVDVCEYPKTLLDDYKIKVQKSDNFNPLSVFTSSKFTQSFAVTPSSTNMTESGTITLDLVTTNIVNGTVLYYSITGASGNINQTDFVTNTTGTVTVQNNAVRLTLQANTDLNTNLEGDETFTVVYRKNSNVGTVVATSSSIVLRDTSNTTTYSITDSGNGLSVIETSNILFTLTTTNLPPNNTYYYTTNGTVTSSYFTNGNTGSFVSNANTTYNILLLGAGSVPDSVSSTFKLDVRSGSLTGPVLVSSNTVTFVDAALADVQATGGNVIIANQYKTHTFNTSGNLLVTGLGLTGNIEYLVIGGGGGGGSGAPGFNGVGSGGGAGGYLTGNVILSTTGTYVVTVGSGGGTTLNGARGTPGNNSNIFNPALSIISLGGGGGGGSPANGTQDGISGGSGGGGNPAGSGTPGQGNPGGAGNQTNYGGGGGGANTAGGGGYVQLGGTGLSSSITGTAVIRAGGGSGGGTPNAGSQAPSAGGGGGEGGFGSTVGGTGTVNTGGGGGGGSNASRGGSGGSGIVIIRYPYSAQTYTFVSSNFTGNNLVEASNANINLQTINVSNGSVLYYTTSGNITNADFLTGNTGSFTLLNSNANITLRLANNIVTGTNTKNFAIQIRSGSNTGPVLSTSNTFIVYSSNVGYYNMTSSGGGGDLYISGDYNVMTFNTSANLNVVSAASIGFTDVEILMVAGGGGPGGYVPGSSRASGGGGGGGVLYRANATLSAQSYSIVVGGGGGGGQYTGGTNGTNSTGFSVIASGGGFGGSPSQITGSPNSGNPGGNGGGVSGDGGSAGGTDQGSFAGWFKYGNPGGGSSGGSAGLTSSISGTSIAYGNGGGMNQYGPAIPTYPGTGAGGIGTRTDYGPQQGFATAASPGVVIVKYRRPTN